MRSHWVTVRICLCVIYDFCCVLSHPHFSLSELFLPSFFIPNYPDQAHLCLIVTSTLCIETHPASTLCQIVSKKQSSVGVLCDGDSSGGLTWFLGGF